MLLEHRLSALLQKHLHSWLNIWLQWIGQRQLQYETRNILVMVFSAIYIRGVTVFLFHGRCSCILRNPKATNSTVHIAIHSNLTMMHMFFSMSADLCYISQLKIYTRLGQPLLAKYLSKWFDKDIWNVYAHLHVKFTFITVQFKQTWANVRGCGHLPRGRRTRDQHRFTIIMFVAHDVMAWITSC